MHFILERLIAYLNRTDTWGTKDGSFIQRAGARDRTLVGVWGKAHRSQR